MISPELSFELKASGFPQSLRRDAQYWLCVDEEKKLYQPQQINLFNPEDWVQKQSLMAYAPIIEELLTRIWIQANSRPIVIEAKYGSTGGHGS